MDSINATMLLQIPRANHDEVPATQRVQGAAVRSTFIELGPTTLVEVGFGVAVGRDSSPEEDL